MVVDRVLQLLNALFAAVLVRGLAVAFAVTILVKGLSREARHLIFFVAIVAFLLIPPARLALSSVRIGALVPVQHASGYRLAAAPHSRVLLKDQHMSRDAVR